MIKSQRDRVNKQRKRQQEEEEDDQERIRNEWPFYS